MAQVFRQLRADKAPLLLADGISDEQAARALVALGKDWELSKKGRTAKPAPQNGHERILRFSDGKVAGSVFVETLPPPDGPEAGTVKVGEVKHGG